MILCIIATVKPRLLTLLLPVCLTVGCADHLSPTGNEAEISHPDSPPIINAHMHSAYMHMEDAPYREQVLKEMENNGITQSVLHINEASDIHDWIEAAPGRFIAGPVFPCWQDGNGKQQGCHWQGQDWPDIDWLRARYESGEFKIMGEMLFVYAGISPTDPRMMPYWALAAELDIPVAVHINRGPPPNMPPRSEGCCPNFNADFGNPQLLREVLEQYPDLRLWLQHAGFPSIPGIGEIEYLEETYSILSDYPNVYVDMTALNSVPPPPVHINAVKDFLQRGFIHRLMMGSDNWEVQPIIERYQGLDFLTAHQKRGILHDNAVRFFKLN